MDPRIDKLVRRTTMVATLTASYFLLTADYGPEPNILDPLLLVASLIKPHPKSLKLTAFRVLKRSLWSVVPACLKDLQIGFNTTYNIPFRPSLALCLLVQSACPRGLLGSTSSVSSGNSVAEAQLENYDNGNGSSSSNAPKKPAWSKPSHGVVELINSTTRAVTYSLRMLAKRSLILNAWRNPAALGIPNNFWRNVMGPCRGLRSFCGQSESLIAATSSSPSLSLTSLEQIISSSSDRSSSKVVASTIAGNTYTFSSEDSVAETHHENSDNGNRGSSSNAAKKPAWNKLSNGVVEIKNAILSAEHSLKESIFGPKKGVQESDADKVAPSSLEKHQKSGG
ncbi:hypothetical protein RND71_015596 [Anisodus tanguticus]|uniref:Uncharacterized protein n=1 Tax=Anisodus tanguticus TaxID=243964 RepID=A0AAE1VBY7_9SOLA|nr:hypothetical protein RND71_015596 [Anisodus tanguticus]